MKPTIFWPMLAGLSLSMSYALAQQRDPTRPPEAAMPPASAASPAHGEAATSAASGPADPLAFVRHRMVVNGKPYLVERGWLRGVGDRIGDARIERLTEREVWLRDANGLRKLSLFPQVDIRPAADPASAAAPRARQPRHPRPFNATATKDTTP